MRTPQTTAPKAFTNCKIGKREAVALAKEHVKQDHLAKGYGYYRNSRPDWKGCSVGCFTKDPGGGHAKYPELFGLPEWLARLQDSIFENLPDDVARQWWHVTLFSSIKKGADLERVLPRFMRWILTEGLVYDAEAYPQVREAVEMCVALYDRELVGDVPTESDWSAARSAARSAAQSAWSAAWSAARPAARSAWSAAQSAAESAARSDAESAWSAAESAAQSAWSAAESAWSAARSDAQSAAWKKIAEKVVELCKECPVEVVK
jgi:hypothetical protein